MGRKLKGKNNKKGGSLKAQLLSHQAVTGKKRDKEEVPTATALEKKNKMNKMKKALNNLTFIPFEQDDNLMLIGEGDFSFTKSLVENGMILPENLIATSFDSRDDLQRKYSDNIETIMSYLEDKKIAVHHEVDGRQLVKSLKLSERDEKKNAKILNNLSINNIMFNFPHTGSGMKDVDRNIKLHQELMIDFFQSCRDFFKLMRKFRSNQYFDKKQRIILTLFEGEPYESWGVKKIARNFHYKVERSGNFNWAAFNGYHHRRTNGTLKDTSKPAGQRRARIYVFEEIIEEEQDEYTKKKDESDDDDD